MKYIVWVKDNDDYSKWEEQGDGPLTEKQATRIVREVKNDCGCLAIMLPLGQLPNQPD